MSAPSVQVVIPHTSDAATGGWRDRAFTWNLHRWKASLPVAHGGAPATDNPGDFNRPAALNSLIRHTTADVVIVADADTSADMSFVQLAVAHAADGGWALAQHYRCLNEDATRRLQESPVDTLIDPLHPEDDIEAETDFSVSGVVVFPRAAYELIGGSETRHTGWGSDDTCLAIMLDTLWQPVVRLPGCVWHHYHPRPLDHSYGQPNNGVQYALTERYKDAAGDPDRVRALIAER